MTFITFNFYIFLIAVLILYYILPLRFRYLSLLMGSISFYMLFYKEGWWLILLTILLSYLFSIMIFKQNGQAKTTIYVLSLVFTICPLLIKYINTIKTGDASKGIIGFVVPLGISFYTISIIAYLTDIYKGIVTPTYNILKYTLYVSFFPHIVQGPIPRYNDLSKDLYEGHAFHEDTFSKGLHLIIWGFFLKLVIADKVAVVVNTIFDNYQAYVGFYVLIGALLYSLQLYADFYACTTLARGIALLFGIKLKDNFRQPYFATSIKDFWQRWHLTLTSFLRDYIYIPLGGNRHGKKRKYLNILIVFAVSGIWHGAGLNYMIWGLVHGIYQIVGELTDKKRTKFLDSIRLTKDRPKTIILKRIITFLLITITWIPFRAQNMEVACIMISNMFTKFNPWILFNNRIFSLGLSWKELMVLLVATIILYLISHAHEKGKHISNIILSKNIFIRWSIYILAIISIMIFGTYGFGFNPQDFIYGGF
ncbi:MAG: hypothetical protein K6G26_08080 [Lachnospiraceae bacterium]|nr:hypothetical protein [Lachnospiraceae bacterium]